MINSLKLSKDKQWLIIWLSSLAALGIWDLLFLNKFAFKKIVDGFTNTIFIALVVVLFTLLMSVITSNLIVISKKPGRKVFHILISFLLHLLRSIPQIVGVLFGYIWVANLVSEGILGGKITAFVLTALIMSLFIFQEVVDLMLERVEHYKKLDFYSAMLVCGISESRIINSDILWKNSRIHIFNKLISVFGMAIFLQCSVDFIISVGLSTSISLVDLPSTLGTLLAHIDSKQDILAIGHTITNPFYFKNLFFKHLQGVTVAFLLVFTLLSVYKISNGYAERHRL